MIQDCRCTFDVTSMAEPGSISMPPIKLAVEINRCPLHAAAPKLLAALEKALAVLEDAVYMDLSSPPDTWGREANGPLEAETEAREAIKEASLDIQEGDDDATTQEPNNPSRGAGEHRLGAGHA